MLAAMHRASSLVSVRAPLVVVPFVCSDGCPLNGLDHVRWREGERGRYSGMVVAVGASFGGG